MATNLPALSQYQKLCNRAAIAADALFARTYAFTDGMGWMAQADRLRELAGRARTNRGMVRLLKMAAYSDIQAEVGVNISRPEADRLWATYCRTNA